MRIKKMMILLFVSLFVFCGNVYAQKCYYKQEDARRTIDLVITKYEMSVIENGEIKDYGFDFSLKESEPCLDKIYVSDTLKMVYTTPAPLNSEHSEHKTTTFILLSSPIKVSCGSVTEIPAKFPELTSTVMIIIQVAVPIILVIMGTLDLFKGMASQKEDEIKKGQKIFVKRLIVAALIFFVSVIVKLLISLVADTVVESNNIIECLDCFVSGIEYCK